MSITVTLPWPPSETSANASQQGNWRKKGKAAKSYKDTCGWECIEQKIKPMRDVGPGEYIMASITFHPPRNERFDWDNIANRAKQGWDAVSEAVGVDDGRWWPVLLDRGAPVKHGRIIITLEKRKPPPD